MAITLTTPGRQKVLVEDRPFASGGEGVVHRIVSPPSYSGHCVKLYSPPQRTPRRERKIDFMIKNPLLNLGGLKGGGCMICWPRELVYQNNRFAGFVMPMAFDNSFLLYELCTPTMKKLPPVWHTKYDRRSGRGVASRLKLCVNIAAAINLIHGAGKYVLVDLKPQNILVTDDGKVSVIDLDSIQITDKNRVVFAAQVATPEYVPVEGNHINPSRDMIPESWDRFSLAVVFYELLFGLHPYAASYKGQYQNSTSVADSIRNGLFVFGHKRNYVHSLPPLHDNFTRLPQPLQSMFVRAFDSGHNNPVVRPKAEEWGRTIFAEVNKLDPQKAGFTAPARAASRKAPAPQRKAAQPTPQQQQTQQQPWPVQAQQQQQQQTPQTQTPPHTSGFPGVAKAFFAVVAFVLLVSLLTRC